MLKQIWKTFQLIGYARAINELERQGEYDLAKRLSDDMKKLGDA